MNPNLPTTLSVSQDDPCTVNGHWPDVPYSRVAAECTGYAIHREAIASRIAATFNACKGLSLPEAVEPGILCDLVAFCRDVAWEMRGDKATRLAELLAKLDSQQADAGLAGRPVAFLRPRRPVLFSQPEHALAWRRGRGSWAARLWRRIFNR